MIKLSPRLQAVYDEIEQCNTLADVGCDHGKIIVKAKIEGRCKNAIAIDISADSLAKAKLLASEHNAEIDCRIGDGVRCLADTECDTLVIAGMGGMEIINILTASKHKFNRYILLPHRNSYELRCYLSSNTISIVKNIVICENKHFYQLMTCVQGESKISEKALFLGCNDLNSTIYMDYLINTREHLCKVRELSGECNEILYGYVCQELQEIKNIFDK